MFFPPSCPTGSDTGHSITYEYDDRGNQIKITNGANITDYTYDAADRLASVTLPDTTSITYMYDADGRRVQQTVGSAVTNYLWDEASPYGDVVLETNGGGATLASYVLGGTGLISQTKSGTTSYYLQDGQGSTRALTNASGNITDTYSFTAFGELFDQTGATANNYLYTGQQFDSLTGLYSLRARYYNPALGRFLSQDTYPYNFGNPVELNRYVYVGNDPVNNMDPSGHLLIEYAPNILKSAAAGSALGTLGGTVYGIVASLACTGGFDAGFIARSAIAGAIGGGIIGGIAAIPALTGLAPAIGATAGLAGYAFAAEDIRSNGLNLCNFVNLAASLIAFTGSAHSGLSGGGPSMQFAFAGITGGTSTSAVQGVAGNSGVLGTLGLVSMMSGGTSSSDIDPGEAQEEIDEVVENLYSKPYFRRLNTPQEQIILERPRYKVLYDPNLKEYAARVYKNATLIGPASIRRGRIEILDSIIHEEIHHWLDITGRPHDEDWIISLTSYIMGIYK